MFGQLDEALTEHPAVWISGSPGAGKTTLVASYLEARRRPTFWYQLDKGDEDLATFFYHLTLIGEQVAAALPLLTPEYLLDIQGFAERFFRNLFSAFAPSTVLVFDNYQEVSDQSKLHAIIALAITELPQGLNLIFISRTDPLPEFSRLQANRLIKRISPNELQLTLEETQAIIGASYAEPIDQQVLLNIHRQADGWMAGLILITEHLKKSGPISLAYAHESRQTIFNYFAAQVFEQIVEKNQKILMRIAFLPYLTVQTAVEMAQAGAAENLLDDLYRDRLFIDKRSGDVASYHFHALFKEFLLNQAQNSFAQHELLTIKKLAADLCIDSGEIAAGAQLLFETENWHELVLLINQHAMMLLHQGRYQTLQQMTALIPQEIILSNPWALYWRGISKVMFNPAQARHDLEQAFHLFRSTDDVHGLFLSCGGIINTFFFSEDDIQPVVHWATVLQQLLEKYNDFPSTEIELQLLVGMKGLIFAQPHHPLLEMLEQRFEQALQADANPLLKLSAACSMIWLPFWRGNTEKVRWIMQQIKVICHNMPLLPVLQIEASFVEFVDQWSSTGGMHPESLQLIQKIIGLMQDNGIFVYHAPIYGNCVYRALAAGDSEDASGNLIKLESALQPHRKNEISQLHFLKAGVALLRGKLPQAKSNILSAMRLNAEAERPYLFALCQYGLAQILIAMDDRNAARSEIRKVIEYAHRFKSPLLEHQSLLVEAYSWLKENNSDHALPILKQALGIARENDYLFLNYWWQETMMTKLLSVALQYDIETEYVRSIIQRRSMHTETSSLENDLWPRPIQIYTLGKFAVLIDGEPLKFSHKTQQKPLELLRYLCTGNGEKIRRDRLVDALWGKPEGDLDEQSLRTTLHRLRRILTYENAIVLEDQFIFLDLRVVWVDNFVFVHAAQQKSVLENQDSMRKTLAYYADPFLKGEMLSWTKSYRAEIHKNYKKLIRGYCDHLLGCGNVNEAIEYYRSAIDMAPVEESFYYDLMKIHIQLGQYKEAIDVYHECERNLLKLRGIPPSAEIQQLYQSIKDKIDH